MSPTAAETQTRSNISEGFGKRLIQFQENIGFQKNQNNEAAACAGKTYVRYMEWRKSPTLPAKIQDISVFVQNACEKFDREDILEVHLETVIWLCFGIERLNPFKSGKSEAFSDAFLINDFLTNIEIYEDIVRERQLNSLNLSKKKKELAITRIIESRYTEDGKTFKIRDSDKKFIGDILEL